VSLTETILHCSQRPASRAVPGTCRAKPGKDLAGKKVHEEDVLPDDEDNDENGVVHKRAGVRRKR
jgi:hypothetical protein